MSEMEGKSNDSEGTSVSTPKDSESGQESVKRWTHNKDHTGFPRGRRDYNDFRKHFGSFRGGKISEYRTINLQENEPVPSSSKFSFQGYRNDNFGRKPFKRNWSKSQHDGKRKKLEVGNRLKECDVGITEFIGDQGFFGVIKERYTDFHVNEITLDGQLAVMTNQDIPVDTEENENLEDLQGTVPAAIWDQLQTLKDPESAAVEIDVTDLEKDQRRAIHTIAKKMTNVISQTIDKENKKIMVILPNKKDSNISTLRA